MNWTARWVVPGRPGGFNQGMADPRSSDDPALVHSPDVFGPMADGEKAVWRGRSAVAEYAFDQAASLPRWTLPETTEVLVTNHRIRYAHTSDELEVRSSEMSWVYPQHIRVQPGPDDGRTAAVAQVQLVCIGSDGSYPALVFAGGELAQVSDADKVANVIRHAVARYRVDNATHLGIPIDDARELVKNLIGPEFSNTDGGEGQTVTLAGALSVPRQAPEPEPEPLPDPGPVLEGELLDPAPDSARGTAAVRLPDQHSTPDPAYDAPSDLATRAADVAARLADLADSDPHLDGDPQLEADPDTEPGRGTDLTPRAERVRRATARFAANSARGKASVRRPERDQDPTRSPLH